MKRAGSGPGCCWDGCERRTTTSWWMPNPEAPNAVPIRLHNNSRFGRQRNGGLFGLEPVSKSWTRGAADCIDMTSGIAARLGYPGSHWLGPRQHFPSRIQGRFSCRVLSLQFLFHDRWGCASLVPRPTLVVLCDHILTGQRSDSGHDVMVAPNRDDGISGPRSILLSTTLSHHPLTMVAAMLWCET